MGEFTESEILGEFGCEYCPKCHDVTFAVLTKATVYRTFLVFRIAPVIGCRIMCLACRAFGQFYPRDEAAALIAVAAVRPHHSTIRMGMLFIQRRLDRLEKIRGDSATEEEIRDTITAGASGVR